MPSQDDLERRAYFALQGAARSGHGWRDDVAAALRSNEPLSPEFREALAQAIDTEIYGFRLDLVAAGGLKKKRQDAFTGLQTRRRNVEIGEWILTQIEQGIAAQDAIMAAASKKGTGWPGYDGCEAALTYTRRFHNWRAKLAPTSATILGDALEGFFHMRDAEGKPLDHAPIGPEVQ